MGHIRKREDRAGYLARYRGHDGRERSKSFRRKVDAQRFLATVEADMVRGTFIDPAHGRRSFGDYALEWQTAQVHRPTTREQVASHLRNHMLPAFGQRSLGSIRTIEVQGFIRQLDAKGLSPNTIEVIYRYFAAILLAAVRDRLIPMSPCIHIKLPRRSPRHVTPLDVTIVHSLGYAMPPRWRAAVLLAAGTGLRQGEVLGLTADRVDLLRRELRIDRQLVTLSSGPPTLAPPKTESSVRTVPLPDSVLDALAAHLSEFPTLGADGLLFTTPDGEPIRRQRFIEAFKRATREVGVVDCGFHDLRHTYASLLIRAGTSVKTVQARLGHASAVETLQTYAHLWPDSEDQTRAAVDEFLGMARLLTTTRASPLSSPESADWP